MSSLLKIISSGEKKQKKYKFNYLSKKEFKELQKDNDEIKVIGSTRLTEVPPDDMNDIDTYLLNQGKYFKVTKPKKALKKGYICVGGNDYIAYDRRFFVVFTPIFGTFCGTVIVCCALGVGFNGKVELEDFMPIDFNDEVSNVETKHYDFQTQGSYTISEGNTKIKVWNPDTNTRVFQYNVYIDDEPIAQTKGISPGNMVEVECKSFLDKKGDHDLVLDLSVLDEETGEVVGQAQRNAILTVE